MSLDTPPTNDYIYNMDKSLVTILADATIILAATALVAFTMARSRV